MPLYIWTVVRCDLDDPEQPVHIPKPLCWHHYNGDVSCGLTGTITIHSRRSGLPQLTHAWKVTTINTTTTTTETQWYFQSQTMFSVGTPFPPLVHVPEGLAAPGGAPDLSPPVTHADAADWTSLLVPPSMTRTSRCTSLRRAGCGPCSKTHWED